MNDELTSREENLKNGSLGGKIVGVSDSNGKNKAIIRRNSTMNISMEFQTKVIKKKATMK